MKSMGPAQDRSGDRRDRGARFASVLFAGGGLIVGATVWTLPSSINRFPPLVLAAIAIGFGALVPSLPWRRWPTSALLVLAFVGHGMLTTAFALAPGLESHYIGMVVLCYLHVGLTQRRGTSLALVPVTVITAVTTGSWSITTTITLITAVVVAESLAHYSTRDAAATDDIEHVLRATRRIGAAPSVEDAASILVEQATHLLRASMVFVYTVDTDHPDVYLNRTSDDGHGPMPVNIHTEPSGVGTTIRSRQPLLVPDARNSPVVSNRLATATGINSLLYLPLPGLTGAPAGVLIIGWTTYHDRLPTFQANLLDILATDAGHVVERLVAAHHLTTQTLTDPLTGVGNRRQWESNLADLVAGDAVVILDLDHFKQHNDHHGHDGGDRALIHFAAAARTSSRANDHVHRLGGDEFAVILHAAHLSGVQAFLARLATDWAATDDELTYSAGWSIHEPDAPAATTVNQADRALYHAKQQGRNQATGHGVAPARPGRER